MPATERALTLAKVAALAAEEKIAQDVQAIDVSEQLALTDIFVIASASNERQVGAIVDEVEEQMRRHGVKPVRREGTKEGRWVLLDFVDVVVHVQHDEERSFYGLERLWKDCPVIPFDANAHQPSGSEPSSDAESRELTETERLNRLLKGQ